MALDATRAGGAAARGTARAAGGPEVDTPPQPTSAVARARGTARQAKGSDMSTPDKLHRCAREVTHIRWPALMRSMDAASVSWPTMGKKDREMVAAPENRPSEGLTRTLELIERAFDGVPPPDHEHWTLHQAQAWDDYEVVDQRGDHKGRWQDLPGSHVRECTQAVAHLDEQGVHYYLPALMSHCIRTPKDRTLWSCESLRYTLQPSTGELKDHQRSRFSLLTHVQREAIVAYLEHMEATEEELLPWRRVLEAGEDPDWFRRFY